MSIFTENTSKMPSLYVHIPFCSRKCLFCSFTIAVGQGHRVDDYVNVLAAEARNYQGMAIETVYFGGGTPTFLPDEALARLIALVRRNFVIAADAEWTIEANPEGVSTDKARLLKDSGINRVSLGVQSFNDRFLKFLGRNHDREQAIDAYDILRRAGFKNVNVDLMFGFPGQTSDELGQDLKAVRDLNSEHVSLYSLTIEENSRFFVQNLKLDDEERLANYYMTICEFLEKAGIPQYEVSNFARQGFESKHNRNYWDGDGYLGLGVGAHGFLNQRRFWNTTKLQDYLVRIETSGKAVEGFEDLSPLTRLAERVVFGLRMNEGIVLHELEQKSSVSFPTDKKQLIDQWVSDGFLTRKDERVKTTMKGRLILDELASRLI